MAISVQPDSCFIWFINCWGREAASQSTAGALSHPCYLRGMVYSAAPSKAVSSVAACWTASGVFRESPWLSGRQLETDRRSLLIGIRLKVYGDSAALQLCIALQVTFAGLQVYAALQVILSIVCRHSVLCSGNKHSHVAFSVLAYLMITYYKTNDIPV